MRKTIIVKNLNGNKVKPTFSKFLTFLAMNNPTGYNRHWKPNWVLCNPCLYHYDYLLKMETFDRDSGSVLREVSQERYSQSMKRDLLDWSRRVGGDKPPQQPGEDCQGQTQLPGSPQQCQTSHSRENIKYLLLGLHPLWIRHFSLPGHRPSKIRKGDRKKRTKQ